MNRVVAADKIFTGTGWLVDHAVLIESGRISRLIPRKSAGDAIEFFDGVLVPAFLDVQVYGAAGRLLAADATAETLQVMESEFRKTGTTVFQPTIATNSIDVFKSAIDAVREYRSRGGKAVHGLHLEGPWINLEKSGAHVTSFIHPPTIEEVEMLLQYGKGVISMITLAPEVCSVEVTKRILSEGIIISAGHSNATYDEAVASFRNGIPAVTHLFNAMSGLHHRTPGLALAAMNDSTVVSSIIPDGHHVHFVAISLAKKIMKERLFAITDAVTETEKGLYQHTLAGDKYECNGTLSGSALSMHTAFKNLVNKAGIEMEEAHRMCSLYPAKLLKCDALYGQIIPGAIADFVVLNNALEISKVINGSMF